MVIEDKVWPERKTLNCRGKLLPLHTAVVMGILNVTPDSFYEASRVNAVTIEEQARKMLNEGVALLDIGGHSTRPGAETVSRQQEAERILPAVEKVCKLFPEAIISVDTYWADVARQALEAGAHIVNDVTAGEEDEAIMEVAAKFGAPYIMMHKQGSFKEMQKDPQYGNVVQQILDYLRQRIDVATAFGIKDIVVDPGFGFGKTTQHNYRLLAHLREFRIFERPILIGLSRKRMINEILGVTPAEALNGTTVLNTLAVLNGASILRVHDVKAAAEAIKLVNAYNEAI